MFQVDAAGGQSLPIAEDDFSPPDPASGKFRNGAALDEPPPMNPDEQAGLNTVGELLDRSSHQVGTGSSMDRNIFVSAAHTIDGVDRYANKPA